MPYAYEDLKPTLFTEAGQRTFLKVRDHVSRLLDSSGACTLDRAISSVTGDSWLLLACVDRLVELGEIHEVPNHPGIVTQQKVYVR